jgi:hypothetical protein
MTNYNKSTYDGYSELLYYTHPSHNPRLTLQGSLFALNCFIKNTLYVGNTTANTIKVGHNITGVGDTPAISRLNTADDDTFHGSWILGGGTTAKAYFNTFYGYGPQTYLSSYEYVSKSLNVIQKDQFGICGVCNVNSKYQGKYGQAVADCLVILDGEDWNQYFGFSATYVNNAYSCDITEPNPDFTSLHKKVGTYTVPKEDVYGILYPNGDGWEVPILDTYSHIAIGSQAGTSAQIRIGRKNYDSVGFFGNCSPQRTNVSTLDHVIDALVAFGLVKRPETI